MTSWTLEEALTEIRKVEPHLKQTYGCFLGLCGGVLRNGSSNKDLDIILIPLNGDLLPDMSGAKKFLETQWGPGEEGASIGGSQTYVNLEFCQYKDKGIDLITIISPP